MMAAVSSNKANSNVSGSSSSSSLRKKFTKPLWKRLLNSNSSSSGNKKGTTAPTAAGNSNSTVTITAASPRVVAAESPKKSRSPSASPSVVSSAQFEAFEISSEDHNNSNSNETSQPSQEIVPEEQEVVSDKGALPSSRSSNGSLREQEAANKGSGHLHFSSSPPSTPSAATGTSFALVGDQQQEPTLLQKFASTTSSSPKSTTRTRSNKSYNSFKSKSSATSLSHHSHSAKSLVVMNSPTSVMNVAGANGGFAPASPTSHHQQPQGVPSNNDGSTTRVAPPTTAVNSPYNHSNYNNNHSYSWGGGTVSEKSRDGGNTITSRSCAPTIIKEQMTLSTVSLTACTTEASSSQHQATPSTSNQNSPSAVAAATTDFGPSPFTTHWQTNEDQPKEDFQLTATNDPSQDNWAFQSDWIPTMESLQQQNQQPPALSSQQRSSVVASVSNTFGYANDTIKDGFGGIINESSGVLPPVGECSNDSSNNFTATTSSDGQQEKETSLLSGIDGQQQDEEKLGGGDDVLLVKEATRFVAPDMPAATTATVSAPTVTNAPSSTSTMMSSRSKRLKGSLKKGKSRVAGVGGGAGLNNKGGRQQQGQYQPQEDNAKNTKKNKMSLSNKKPQDQTGLGEGAAANQGTQSYATSSAAAIGLQDTTNGNTSSKKKKRGSKKKTNEVVGYSSPRMVSNERYLRKVNKIDHNGEANNDTSPAAAPVAPATEGKKDNHNKSPSPAPAAPHLYAEITVPSKKKRYHHVLSQPPNNVARQSSTRSNGTDGGDVSLAMTSISSLTGRESLFASPGNISSNGMGGLISAYSPEGIAGIWCNDPASDGLGDPAAVTNHVNMNAAEEENYFDYSNHNDDVNPNNGNGAAENEGGIHHHDTNTDDNILEKLLGAFNEVFKTTCRCFDLGGGGDDAVGGEGGVGGGPATAASVVGMGAATIMETVNDTTATIANTMMSRSNCNTSNVTMTGAGAAADNGADPADKDGNGPTFSEPMVEI